MRVILDYYKIITISQLFIESFFILMYAYIFLVMSFLSITFFYKLKARIINSINLIN